MRAFSIDETNAITVHETRKAAKAIGAGVFTSEVELADLIGPDSRRLVEIYKLGQGRYLRMLLSTGDLRQLGQSTRTVAALAKLDRDRIASHARTLAELQRERKTLQERQAQLAGVRAAAERASAAAQRAAIARNDLIRDIDRRRDLNAQLAGELQSAQQKVQAALRDLATGAPAADAEAAGWDGRKSLALRIFWPRPNVLQVSDCFKHHLDPTLRKRNETL